MSGVRLDRRGAIGAIAAGAAVAAARARGAEDVPLRILAPLPGQVHQRRGYVPTAGRRDQRRPADFGTARVGLTIETRLRPRTIVVRIEREADQFGPAAAFERKLDAPPDGDPISLAVDVPAGGWYRLHVDALDAAGGSLATARVERVGVGEVFLIGGQSYAGNHNDELLELRDPFARATACDVPARAWRTCHDPQPTTTGAAGSIWPALADALLPIVQCPIGLVNVSVGATASRRWMPGEALFDRLLDGARAAGDFRAVLWQQGESDVIEKTTTETYVERYRAIRRGFVEKSGRDVPWLLAKSTLHPTVYDDPVHESAIRKAIDSLWREPGFAPGPDTDILAGENRGPPGSQRHWTGSGQRRAAAMWFAAIWTMISNGEPGHES